MAQVGSIIVRIGANTDDLVKGVGRAQSSLAKIGSAAVSIGKIIASALLAAGAAIGAMALKGVQLGNELARAARIVGITTAELGGLHHAAALSEVSTEQLDKGLQRLGRTVSDADSGLKSAVNTLQELGLDANEIEKLPLSEQFLRVTDAMKGMTSQGDKLRIATQLFGKSGAELIPLLDESSASIRAMMNESKQLGLQLDQTQSRVVQEASDGLDTMKGAVTGLSMQLGATFGPAIELAAKAMANLLGWVTRSLPKLAALAERFLGITRAAQDLSDVDLSVTLIEQIKHLDAVNNRVAEMQELQRMSPGPGNVTAVNDALKAQAEVQARINELLAERVKRKREAEAPIEPTGSDEEDDSSLDEKAKAAQAELELITAVAEEKERLIQLEAEQELEWATIMAEERERLHAEELTQEQEWAAILAAERDRVIGEELFKFQEKERLLTQARKEGHEERAKFDKMAAGMQVKTTLDALVAMTSGVAQHSKSMFKINKLAAIGNAVMNTAQGVTKALASYPPPLSFAMAAAQAAAGAAQISAIKNTQFQGGGGGTTPSAAGAAPVVNDQPIGGSGTGKTNNIRVEGINPGSLFTGRALRELLERLKDAQKDGGTLVIA
jgi:hypothetical protein